MGATTNNELTLDLLVLSSDSFCKQFGPKSGLAECRAWFGSKLFDILIIFLKEFFDKYDFKKIIADDKKARKTFPWGKELIKRESPP